MKFKDTKITVLILISTVILALACFRQWINKKQTSKNDVDTICEKIINQINHLQCTIDTLEKLGLIKIEDD